ncbi:MAG: hypothetical protein LHW46_09405 [Candidatus Cloacimonetes bacterium]|nr:hypothetical protein [Candidatus Cloacimonadota bacterium]MDD2544483.1 hypothetical protein [Candidatus Cloacimonadota bacterium]MDD2683418.1 hypothetical protein [Candidatus Cloacimonadota bacterium]MDD3578319.1 hypothetical protein [Candidatus Cloacimonadota bacterium]
MNTKALVTMLLLLLCTAIFASEDAGDAAEHERKTQELNQLAERFKAETGFEGDITYNHQYMTFSNIIGNFKDIVVTSPQDTVSMRQIFDRVVAKVTPFISAREGQLIRGKTSSNVNGTRVRYEQIVNGYRIEGAGFLNVAYNYETKKITVTDATVSIPSEQIPINIGINQAVQIAIQHYDPNYNYDPGNELSNPRSKLVYFAIPDEIGSHQYRLCYMIAFWGLTVFVDPSSGEIIHTRSLIIEDYHCNVDGEVYE